MFYGACGVEQCADCLPLFDEENNEIRGCICRLGPDCPRPGRCDDSAIAAEEECPDCSGRGCRECVPPYDN